MDAFDGTEKIRLERAEGAPVEENGQFAFFLCMPDDSVGKVMLRSLSFWGFGE